MLEVEFLLPFPCFPCLPPLPSAGFIIVLIPYLMKELGELPQFVCDAVSPLVSASDPVGIEHLLPLALSCGLACLFSPGSCFVEAGPCTRNCRSWRPANLAL